MLVMARIIGDKVDTNAYAQHGRIIRDKGVENVFRSWSNYKTNIFTKM